MYLPSDFVVNDAVECGKLIDQAYAQYVHAVAPVPSAVPWTIQDGYNNLGIFSALESGKMLPFGFVVSKNRRLFVVIRGTQTPLEWLDDASIQPKPFVPGWGSTTVGFGGIHDQIFPTIEKLVSEHQEESDDLFVTGHSLGAALANLTAAHLIGAGTSAAEKLTVYSFSGPRTGDPIFAAQYNQKVARAWRIFNTEDLVPTLPLSNLDSDPKSTLGLFETNIELVLKLFLKPSPFRFQHVNEPVALTYQLNTVADNHNLTQLYQRLLPPTPSGVANRS
jgi:Lipase (class 3)